MAFFRRAVLAAALAGSGLVATAGGALATEDHDWNDSDQSGIANVSDTQSVVPTNVCGDNVPVNVLGVQVPIQDLAGNVPAGSGSDDDGGNAAGVEKSCGTESDLGS